MFESTILGEIQKRKGPKTFPVVHKPMGASQAQLNYQLISITIGQVTSIDTALCFTS